MMANGSLSMRKGFTIVELLVVIVVLGVLAGITTVVFNGAQDRAYSAKVISTVDSYGKALKMYHIINGQFPDYGPTWSSCLGTTSQYPATADFPVGACTKHTSSTGVVTYDYAYDVFYNELKKIMPTMPDTRLKQVQETYTSGASTLYRGIYYEHQNNSPGASYPDWAYIEYVLKGQVPCPQDYSTRYKAAENVTFCSTIFNAMDGGTT